MIDEICARDLALIRETSIMPSPGMTAITGETGAGKTALLNSCRLLMGQRAEKDMVREGEPSASVQGRIYCSAASEEGALPFEEELIISRSISADGRSRAKVNGEIVSVGELKERMASQIDLCSQHDQQLLARPSRQRALLDLWAGESVSQALAAYGTAFDEAKAAQEAAETFYRDRTLSESAIEEARYTLRKIEEVGPSQEEYDSLVATLRVAENAELLARVMDGAHDALSEENGVLDDLNQAAMLIEEGAKADESLAPYAASLREAGYIIEDVARDVGAYRSAIELDVGEFEMMQEKVSAYQSLMRTYGPAISDVLGRADEARRTLRMVEDAEELEAEVTKRVAQAEEALKAAAAQLSTERSIAAPSLGEKVTEVLVELEMGSAAFLCAVELQPRDLWTRNGADRVEFLFMPASGMQPRPLSRIASGGELSRVMLALHGIMGQRDEIPTLVFDEIDAGVGGSTATALGAVLKRLAATHQVIVVTHLAQIAAQADKQYVVTKSEGPGGAQTDIAEVQGADRVEEIARMLSGSHTETAIAHAKELLEG